MTTRIKRVVTTINDAGHAVADAFSEILINGQWYPLDPVTLDTGGPEWAEWQQTFSASVINERDQLRLELEQCKADLEKSHAEGERLSEDLERTRSELVAARAELDEVRGDLDKSKTESERLTAQAEGLRSQLAALEDQVTPDSPRQIPPYTFLSLLKPEEIIALQTSLDPTVIIGRAKLQTIITFVDLDNEETIGLVRYMESIELVGPGRADQILAGESPPA